MKKPIFAVLFAISGCVMQNLDNGLKSLVGQPMREAVKRLGYPDGQREIMGQHFYVWSTDHTGLAPLPAITTTNASVGGTPIYSTTTSTAFMPVNYNCTIELAVTPISEVILGYQWHGNPGGCQMYAKRLH